MATPTQATSTPKKGTAPSNSKPPTPSLTAIDSTPPKKGTAPSNSKPPTPSPMAIDSTPKKSQEPTKNPRSPGHNEYQVLPNNSGNKLNARLAAFLKEKGGKNYKDIPIVLPTKNHWCELFPEFTTLPTNFINDYKNLVKQQLLDGSFKNALILLTGMHTTFVGGFRISQQGGLNFLVRTNEKQKGSEFKARTPLLIDVNAEHIDALCAVKFEKADKLGDLVQVMERDKTVSQCQLLETGNSLLRHILAHVWFAFYFDNLDKTKPEFTTPIEFINNCLGHATNSPTWTDYVLLKFDPPKHDVADLDPPKHDVVADLDPPKHDVIADLCGEFKGLTTKESKGSNEKVEATNSEIIQTEPAPQLRGGGEQKTPKASNPHATTT